MSRGDRPGPAAHGWSPRASYVLLATLTVLCLVPFVDRAFNIDEPLFVWAAKQIAAHPLDPYGFRVNWYMSPMPMSEVTKNPPLASYYAALAGVVAGWSERTLHLAFLLPALAAVLGTYLLARRLCRAPLLAAAAALLTPGFLVSASTVMCDTLMLALWVLAVALWIEGLERGKPALLAGSALLVAAGALTKYFAVALIPLLLVYSLVRRRRPGAWAWHLLVPVVLLAGYQAWTRALYGRGLLWDAAFYTGAAQSEIGIRALPALLDAVVFAGGCALPVILFAPLLWRRRAILLLAATGALAGSAVGLGWLEPAWIARAEHRGLVGLHFAVYFCGGASLLALAAADLRRRRDAGAALLALWVVGTLFFAGVLNWTVNARSVLPLVPAAEILLARRLEDAPPVPPRWRPATAGALLLVSGLLAVGVTLADAELADTARRAATVVRERTRGASGTVRFQGHWGFQYYMESFGARAADFATGEASSGDAMVVPGNNTSAPGVRPDVVGSEESFEEGIRLPIATMSRERGAGLYAASWGPLPFAFGPVPPERYRIVRLQAP